MPGVGVGVFVGSPDGTGGGAAPWTPASLTAFVVELRNTGLQWQGDGITPAVATDDRVYRWDGEAGGNAVAANGALRLYRTADGGVRGDGSVFGFQLPGTTPTAEFTVAACVRATSGVVGGANPGWIGTPWDISARFYGQANYTQVAYFDPVLGTAPAVNVPAVGTYFIIAIRRQASGQIQVRVHNGGWVNVSDAAGGAAQWSGGQSWVISPSGGALDSNQVVRGVVRQAAAITEDEWTALETYWAV
jgi:hypothetical protein